MHELTLFPFHDWLLSHWSKVYRVTHFIHKPSESYCWIPPGTALRFWNGIENLADFQNKTPCANFRKNSQKGNDLTMYSWYKHINLEEITTSEQVNKVWHAKRSTPSGIWSHMENGPKQSHARWGQGINWSLAWVLCDSASVVSV